MIESDLIRQPLDFLKCMSALQLLLRKVNQQKQSIPTVNEDHSI